MLPRDLRITSGDESPTDDSLVRRIREQDEGSAREFFERYIGRLKRLVDRQMTHEVSGLLDADDVTQSIFRTLFRRLREGQYEVPEGETIWRLLATIALNKVRRLGAHHRAAKRDIRRSASWDAGQLAEISPARDEATAHTLRITIEDLLSDLSMSQKQMIHMRLEGHDVQSIAEATRRSKRSVERVLAGFRQRLQAELEDEPA